MLLALNPARPILAHRGSLILHNTQRKLLLYENPRTTKAWDWNASG